VGTGGQEAVLRVVDGEGGGHGGMIPGGRFAMRRRSQYL
jgi:hypothetical protein